MLIRPLKEINTAYLNYIKQYTIYSDQAMFHNSKNCKQGRKMLIHNLRTKNNHYYKSKWIEEAVYFSDNDNIICWIYINTYNLSHFKLVIKYDNNDRYVYNLISNFYIPLKVYKKHPSNKKRWTLRDPRHYS